MQKKHAQAEKAAAQNNNRKTEGLKDPNALPEKTMKFIDNETIKVSKNVGFSYHEEEDFKQMMYLEAIKARETWNAAKGASLETFLYGVLKLRLKNWLRDRKTLKRTKVVMTLDMPIDDAGNGGSDDEVSEETNVDQVEDLTGAGFDISDLRSDVKAVIHALGRSDDELVRRYAPRVCVLLMDGVPKSRIHEHMHDLIAAEKCNREYIRDYVWQAVIDAFKSIWRS